MKELSIEEKAKAYEEKLDVARHIYADPGVKEEDKYYIEVIFPELAESENERIRKEVIATIHLYYGEPLENEAKEMIAWLEKQGEKGTNGNKGEFPIPEPPLTIKHAKEVMGIEQKPADKVKPKFKVKYEGNEYNVLYVEDIAGVTFYGIEDEPNHIYYVLPNNCEIVSEQKPADKVEPKFKVGDTIRPKGSLAEYTIESIYGECYHGKGWGLAISGDNEYELVRHKSVEWNEEDETGLSDALWAIQKARAIAKDENDMGNLWYAEHWLKSLKDRCTYKPSKEQMKALYDSIPENVFEISEREQLLESLYRDLEKL